MLRIAAPTEVTGKVVGVLFVDGVAQVDETEHRAAVAYFRRHPEYRIEAVGQPKPAPAGDETPKAPGRSASKADWKAYAIGQDMPEADAEAATRDELAERFLGPKES